MHGKEEYERAVNLADHLFNNKFKDLSKKDIEDLFAKEEIKQIDQNSTVIDLLISIGVATSKREAREFVKNGAVSINGEKIEDGEGKIQEDMFIENTYIVIKRGKKNYYIGKK